MLCRCSCRLPSAIWEIFLEFLIFCNLWLFHELWPSKIIGKYEKSRKYLTILHETARDNCFIVKSLVKSNESRVILFTYELDRPCLIWFKVQLLEAKTASTNFTWLHFKTFDSFIFSHFNLNILYSVHLFGIRWFFAINLFSSFLFQIFDYFWKHVPNKLLISLCWQTLHQI